MRILTCAVAVLVLSAISSTASGQPGRTQPPPPPPAPGYGQPYAVPYSQLSPEERKILEKGEYSDGEIVGGGLLGSFLGLGLGHAAQGRFREKGWIFLVGEAVGSYVFMWSLINCVDDIDNDSDHCNGGMLATSIIAVAVLRIWEIVDLWTVPAAHNREYRRLRNRLYQQQRPYYQPARWGLFAAPGKDGGGIAGVMVRF